MGRPKIRFVPFDNDEFGFISFIENDTGKNIAALIINESLNGACMAINRKLVQPQISLSVGLHVLVKVGKLDPEEAVIRWITAIDDDIIKLGIEYQK